MHGESEAVRRYFTHFLPQYAGKQWVEGLAAVSALIGFRVDGPDSTQAWAIRLEKGCVTEILPGSDSRPEVSYQVSEETFLQVSGGTLRAEEAFLRGRVKIQGGLLKGLKLAALLQKFFRDHPYPVAALHQIDMREGRPAPELDTAGVVEEIGAVEASGRSIPLRLVYPERGAAERKILLAPPHPLLGATVDNPTLRSLSLDLARAGMFAARFGYSFDAATTEAGAVETFWNTSDTLNRLGLPDLLAAWDWLAEQPPRGSGGMALIGYSYGAQLALWALDRAAPERFVLMAPVVSQLGPERLSAKVPTLLVHGDGDFATASHEFAAMEKDLPPGSRRAELRGADHFFQGCGDSLSKAILQHLTER
ncbi:MAG: SCP2 sterol-binding domain-containing protein [Candidatus Omnitrophica bacterium]|nr:SCP2 sterol-binding domain-containing protein [Candidatus Omnitrophota bacterium]